ncbi:hypothetical protein BDA99DRAFT_502423 [Phascolomyces articulosus]|uniref:Uncharacterized protein n=1 Tax=Phascolomyces articulosus TaxID=60185 RepID=A0AAD5PGG3_9FUNG|nr:hypothetical protein BDA99DRAFT_502423 [Phascolomyces articulosus]
MSIRPLPISTTLDPTIVQDLFDKATHALNKCKYEETIDLTSEAVKRIHQLQLLAVLDHRAYALGMKYKFDDAIKDAERMIVCGPECSGGYLRLGSLLDIQGKSSAAIKVYQQGLDRVLEDDPEYENIVERHKQSKEKNERCVDFITSLPPHVSDYIITLLSLSDKLKWFDVCTAWNKRIMGDESTWSVISAEDAPAISEALSHIARHIEDLTITSESTDIWLEYLNHMKDGYFKKIKTLKLVDRISEY